MTDISVKIDSSEDLVGDPFSKANENAERESDPLALHDEEANNGENGVTSKENSCNGNTKECSRGRNGDETSVLGEKSDHVDAENQLVEVSKTNDDRITDLSTLDANAPTPDLPDPLSPETNEIESTDITKKQDENPETNVTGENTVTDDHGEEKVRDLETIVTETETVSDPLKTDSDFEGVKDKDIEESKPLDTSTDAEMTDDESISVEERVRKLFETDITELESKRTENKVKEINQPISEKVEDNKNQEVQEKPKTNIIDTVVEKTEPFLEKPEVVTEKTETVVLNSEAASKPENTHTEIKALLEKPIEKDSRKTDIEKSKISKPAETNLKTLVVAELVSVSENKVTKTVDIPDKLNVPENAEKMDVDVEKTHKVHDKIRVKNFELKENKSKNVQPINGDIAKDDQRTKRRASDEIEESPMKRLCQEVEKSYPNHESIVNDYLQSTAKNNVEEIETHTEHLLSEIQTLRESIEKKEQEWNNLLHLKKVKEEILLRLIRRKQVLSFEKSSEINGSLLERSETLDYLNQSRTLAIDKSDEISGLSLKHPSSSSVLRQTVSPINPIQNLNAMTPVMPMPPHFNPMAGLPPPYDKAAAAHMQNMSNNIQNMSNSMQTMSNNLQNIQHMSNNMQNMNVMQNMPKPVYQPMMLPGPMQGFPRDVGAMNGQMPGNFGMPMGRQGPTKDVKSIIADYRQRNPDVTPRRGRRMKSILNPNMMNVPRNIAPKESMNNVNNLNMLLNNLDMNQRAMLERLQQAGGLPNSIFKDALVQFATMQQQQANAGLIPNRPMDTVPPVINRPEHHPKERRRMERPHEEPQLPHKPPERLPSTSPRLPPPPYPEISLLPVSTAQEPTHSQSLLHGILTKPSAAGAPTLALLLTSPDCERPILPLYGQAKNCGEITITPVAPAPEPQHEKPEEVVQLQDDEESPAPSESDAVDSPATSGRLVIDESGPAEDAPLCQGCRRRDAQFVCAGCANQWYCSRDCQVAAWDDHSEMCSG